MKVYEETLEEEGKKLSGSLIKLENGSIVLFDEKENIRLGTLAAGIPEFDGKHRISAVLLGERNETEAKLLAERISVVIGGIALVSIHAEPLTRLSSQGLFIKLAMKLVEKSKKD